MQSMRGLILFLMCLVVCTVAKSQVQPSAYRGGETLSAGGTFSAFHLDYGPRNLLGGAAFVDAKLRYYRIGLEAEARWLDLHEQQQVHEETYLVGPLYSFSPLGRWRPYAKVLLGNGRFTFPYNYAHGSYLAIAPGGGLDYRITNRIYIRAIDAEYQRWPGFTGSSFSSFGLSAGIRFRIH